MRIPLDRESSTPIYKQIEGFIRTNIENKKLAVNSKLPSIRRLSTTLSVNRITVEMAYQQLEADGLVEKRVGSGTYILPCYLVPSNTQKSDYHAAPNSKSDFTEDSPWPLWQRGPLGRIRPRYSGLENPKAILSKKSKPINFTGGIGDPNLFPIAEFSRIIQRVIKRDGVIGLSYGEPNGFPPLRKTICQIMASLGTQIEPDNVLITTGSQQAINLVVQLLLQSGDTVVSELPTYSGAVDLFRAFGIKNIGIPMDGDGMRMDILEKSIQQHHPKLIYTIPTYHNPTGISMSGKKRRQLLALAEKYNIPVLEDDYVSDLRYEGCGQPTLKSLDQSGHVLYTSTFSKMLMPDLRIGFLIAEGPVYKSLVNLKCLNDLATSNLFQRALESYLSIGRYHSHLRKTIRIYRKRRDCMANALKNHLADQVEFSLPKGGLFIWVRLVVPLNHSLLLDKAIEAGISFFSGKELLSGDPEVDRSIRLNFAYQQEEDIEDGVKRLAQVINEISAEQGV